jgi:hypothetical protein
MLRAPDMMGPAPATPAAFIKSLRVQDSVSIMHPLYATSRFAQLP